MTAPALRYARRDDSWILHPELLAVQQKRKNAAALRGLRAVGVVIAIFRCGKGWTCALGWEFGDEDRGFVCVSKAEQSHAIAHALTEFETRNEAE